MLIQITVCDWPIIQRIDQMSLVRGQTRIFKYNMLNGCWNNWLLYNKAILLGKYTINSRILESDWLKKQKSPKKSSCGQSRGQGLLILL